MTIGKNSRKSSARSSLRAPKFLDKSSGFYGRLDEPEAPGEGGTEAGEGGVASIQSSSVVHMAGADHAEKAEVLDYTEGMMEDDGETLLQRKPSRRSGKWRRSSRRKQEEETARDERPSLGTDIPVDPHSLEDNRVAMEAEMGGEKAGGVKEPTLVHFASREDADDQVLIRDKKRGRDEEGQEERRMKMEQEDGMKMVKRNTVKNYRKALERAVRRGWEAFVTNLYSVTLTPVTSSSPPSSSPSSKKKQKHSSVLAELW